MNGNQLNTLLIDSSEQDYTTTRKLLAKVKEWEVNLDWAPTYEAALTKMEGDPYDICLLNCHADRPDGLAFLRKATENGRTTSLILLLDSEDDTLAGEALKAGAVDYLVIDQIDASLLERSIRYAVKHKQLEESLQDRFKKQTSQLAAMSQQLQQEVNRYKQTEKMLRERERQYRMFFNLDVYGIEVLDTEGNIVNCNPTYAGLLGYSQEEIIGRHTTAFASDKSKSLFKRKLSALEKRGYAEGEVELIRKDGATLTLWRRYRAIYDDAGDWTGAVSFNRDITERMKAVKQISSLARALEQSPVAIMLTDESGNVDYANFSFTELTEYEYDEMVGQNLHTIQSESLSAEEYKELWETVSAGNEWRGELRNHKKHGEEYWEAVTITPMFDSRGEITHFIVVKEDISERRRTEAETMQSQRRVGDLMTEHISGLTATNEALEHEIADRKRAEATLRRSRARLKAQYKSIPMATYSWQKAGDHLILVDYNDAAEEDSEGRIADFMGQPAGEVFKDRPEVLADFARCLNEKTVVRREAVYQLVTTGENRHYVTTYNFVPPNLVIVHIEDITKYKEIEAELKEYRDRLEALTAQQASDLAKTKETLRHEPVEHKHAEEVLDQTEEHPHKVEDALEHELADHEHAEERLKEVASNINERLREQYRTIPIPAYSWQAVGGEFILIDFNDAAATFMGRIVDFLGKSAGEVFKNRPQVLDDFSSCLNEERTVTREGPYRLVTTGEKKYFKTTYDYLPPNLVIVHIEDISEHKKMEAKLDEYRSRFTTIATEQKAGLAKRNQAIRREIHKRKQAEHTVSELQTELTKNKEALQQEIAKRQEAEQILSRLETEVEQYHNKLENLVKERTTALTKINEQLQRTIVEHQRAEDSLRDARTRLKTQYKSIPVPTYSWQNVGDDFILIDYNDEAKKISQGTIADLMGNSVSEVFKDRPQVLGDFSRCFDEKKTVKREAPYKLLRTGETRHFVTTYNFVPPNLIIVYIEDISEYKRTEEALQESEAQVELMCRFSPDAKLTFVNNVYSWYFNQGRADLIGRKLPFIFNKDLAKVKTLFASFTPENPVKVIEYRVVKPNGVMRKQQWINHAMFDNHGKLIEIQSVGRDITKRKNQ